MTLLILITFYIINLSFIIKTQSCSVIEDISVYSCPEGKYYNSMSCSCEDCESSLINENICYSERFQSIYGKGNLLGFFYENGTRADYCPNGYYVTELDNEGKWLGYLMCTHGTYISSNNENKPPTDQYQLYTLTNENKQSSDLNLQSTTITPNYNPDSDEYYNNSCLNGYYEKSCQYLANLCVLSIYYYKNDFCQSINLLSRNLINKKIINDHLLKFNSDTELILDQIIEIETSFDSKDNQIHINLIDLYIAK